MARPGIRRAVTGAVCIVLTLPALYALRRSDLSVEWQIAGFALLLGVFALGGHLLSEAVFTLLPRRIRALLALALIVFVFVGVLVFSSAR